jgi:hypothetical protein
MGSVLKFLSLLFVIAWILPTACTTYVQPDEIGVRRSILGGVLGEDLGQGHRVDIPLYHTMYRLPQGYLYLEFLQNTEHPALELRTRGDNVITVEATVMYRIVPGSGYKIIEEGFGSSYREKIYSVSRGFLLEHLGNLTNEAIQKPDEREKIAASAVVPLNAKLAQYHVQVPKSGVVIRRIRFQNAYEERLQAKQLYAVQGRLDQAKESESAARQSTDTVQKGIDKDVRIKTEEWQQKIEKLQAVVTIKIADIDAEVLKYDKKKRASADADCARKRAEGNLAEDKAEALGERLKAEALSTPAGRTYSAIIAAREFELGEIQLNSLDPEFLKKFGSMKAWREMFLSSGR